ncbi:MAG TPA: succinylglutamate desuccinylase/aspartoacylase family protein [Aggregatilineales bacterium]|nr:succinylglutamate desuccinylase/aspartoacylase family protein [Aggregatilineales bacterium]
MTLKSPLQVGTACGQPGKIVYGTLEAVELPTGGADQFPIIIAQGEERGPVLWLTGSIHGAEYTGIAVIHELLTPELAMRIHGAIVAVPNLNPAGLRTGQRAPYYGAGQDPNRLFPGFVRRPGLSTELPPSAMEVAYERLFNCIRETADYLIDLHNYSIGALSFAFRDPIYYRGGRDRAVAEHLQSTTGQMLEAFGHTIINEYVSTEYVRLNLHRSTSGAALNTARIPAFTAELGGYMTVDRSIVGAAVSGIRNVMRWATMLDGPMESISGIKVLTPGYPMRRMQHPQAPASGIIHYLVKAGDTVVAGEPVVRLTDIYGRPVGDDDGHIRTEHDGIVIGLSLGAVCYKNETLMSLAVRDDEELIHPLPG